MPRIYASDNDPIDFCKHCFPSSEVAAFDEYGNRGDGPDDRGNCFGYDAAHPDYDGEDYRCAICNEPLTGIDD